MSASIRPLLPFFMTMAAVVLLSNILVQYPVQATVGGINLADLLTWGAFTYPVAFLVTDLTNRRFGVARARMVVAIGFLLAVLLSIWLATPRIAIASGTAFLVAQLLDVSIFDRMRRSAWWQAPLVSSLIGSAVDTLIFFSLAFAPVFGALDFGGCRWFAWLCSAVFGSWSGGTALDILGGRGLSGEDRRRVGDAVTLSHRCHAHCSSLSFQHKFKIKCPLQRPVIVVRHHTDAR